MSVVVAVPTADVSNSGWTKSAGANFYSLISKATRQPTAPSLLTFVTAPANGGLESTLRVQMGDPGGHPNGFDSGVVWVYLSNVNNNGLSCSLIVAFGSIGEYLTDGPIYDAHGANSGSWVSIPLDSVPEPSATWPIDLILSGDVEDGPIKVYEVYVEFTVTAAVAAASRPARSRQLRNVFPRRTPFA